LCMIYINLSYRQLLLTSVFVSVGGNGGIITLQTEIFYDDIPEEKKIISFYNKQCNRSALTQNL